MKITPLELRQFEFEKTFRGYSVEEVDMFINNLAQEWERVLTETKMMRMQLELAEKEAAKLREIEMTLFKTLKTAEDTSTMITEQANQQAAKHLSEVSQKAEQHLSDAETKAARKIAEAEFEAEKQLADAYTESEKQLSDARKRANEIIRQAEEKAKYVNEEVLNDVKNIERDFDTLRNYKDNLLAQLRGLANATIEHVERFEDKFDVNSIQSKIEKANEILSFEETKAVVEPLPVNDISDKLEKTQDEVNEVVAGSLPETNYEVKLTEAEPIGLTRHDSDDMRYHYNEKTPERIDETPVTSADNEDDDMLVERYDDDTLEFTENVKTAFDNTESKAEETAVDVAARVEALEESVKDKVVESYPEDAQTANNSAEYVEETDGRVDVQRIAFLKDRLRQSNLPDYETDTPEAAVVPSSINNFTRREQEAKVTPGDDLTRIEGIGPKIQDVLNEAGIATFRDLATTPLFRVKEHLSNAGSHYSMADASTWTEQALLAAEGRWDELETRQRELVGGRETERVSERIAAAPEPISDVAVERSRSWGTPNTSEVRPVNNLENITEEMLEKVNKVKSAIRKAMSEKSDKSDGEKDGGNLPTLDDVMKRNRSKGGSFFDNID